MRIGILGINHKLAPLELRELLAKTCQRRLAPENSMHGEHSFVLLLTCNRTEVYFSSDDLVTTHTYLLSILRCEVKEDFDQKLYSYFGKDCLQHLCRVTAGLDSAIVAETEIQGQVKKAYESAMQFCQLPYEMHYLFQKALGIAKKARSVLPVKPGLPDLEHAILQTGLHFFSKVGQPKILFVGASDINEKILAYFKSKQLACMHLCNRSEKAGMAFATKYGVKLENWEILKQWEIFDWIILGTKAPGYLLKAPLKQLLSHKLVIDLSVPRNADPHLGYHSHISLMNIDQINRQLKIRRKHLLISLNQAERFVSQAIEQHTKLFQEKENNRLRLSIVNA